MTLLPPGPALSLCPGPICLSVAPLTPPSDLVDFRNADKSHVDDPLTFQDGGSLSYRVGDLINNTAHTHRCATLDHGPGVTPSGPTQETNVTSYVWAYQWPAGSNTDEGA